MIYLPLMIYQEGGEEGVTIYPFTIDDFRTRFPEVTLPEFYSIDDLTPYGVEMVWPTDKPIVDTLVDKVVEQMPVYIGGAWYQSWLAVELTPAELAALEASAIEETRIEADLRLKGLAGITNMAFMNEVKFSAEMEAYIAVLRDPSTLPGYPYATEFPDEPASKFDGAGLPINAYSREESDARYVLA